VTVIAYDGRYVAADRRVTTDSGMIGVSCKLDIHEQQVLTTCGPSDHGEALVIWFKDGKNPAAFPFPKHGEREAYLYVFGKDQPVMCFQTWPAPVLFAMREFAAGTGGDVARTALHLGRDAREAVRLANELNCYCGGGVDYIDLHELATTGKAHIRNYFSAHMDDQQREPA
jgi:hypothetical protein